MSSLRVSNFYLFWAASVPLVTSPERWRLRILCYALSNIEYNFHLAHPDITTHDTSYDNKPPQPWSFAVHTLINWCEMKMCNAAYVLLHSCPCHIVSLLTVIYWNGKSSSIHANDTSNHISVFIWYVIAGPCTISRNNRDPLLISGS